MFFGLCLALVQNAVNLGIPVVLADAAYCKILPVAFISAYEPATPVCTGGWWP